MLVHLITRYTYSLFHIRCISHSCSLRLSPGIATVTSVRVADAIDTEKHILHQFRRTLEIISARIVYV